MVCGLRVCKGKETRRAKEGWRSGTCGRWLSYSSGSQLQGGEGQRRAAEELMDKFIWGLGRRRWSSSASDDGARHHNLPRVPMLLPPAQPQPSLPAGLPPPGVLQGRTGALQAGAGSLGAVPAVSRARREGRRGYATAGPPQHGHRPHAATALPGARNQQHSVV